MIRVVFFPAEGLVGELVAVLVGEPLGETVGEPLGELVTGGRLRVGVLLGALRVGVDEGSFRADFDCLGAAAADETPAGWFPAGLEAAGAGLGAGADARGVLPMVPAGAGDAECLTAAGGESRWPALRLTASTPPPARATTATTAMAAIARLLRQVKAAGAARCTGKPSAPKEFDRLMTRSR